jgi:hypothetical protein
MAPETLKVDTTALSQAGDNFLTASQGIPQPPTGYTPSGSDPLSMAIAAVAPQFLAPIAAGLPVLKAQTAQFAQNIKTVAERYAATDAQSHAKLSGQMGGGSGNGGGGGSAGSPASGVAAGVGGPAAGAAQGAGQLGQMLQMPVQMASQAAQIPQQVMGMAGSLPQAAMQGAQQVAEQVSQVAGKAGGPEKPDGKPEEAQDREGKHRREESPEPNAGAAPAVPNAERVPDPVSGDAHRHASSRQSPENVL